MQLQDACGHLGGDRAEEGLFDDLGLACAVDHHQHLACLHDGADAHGISLLGHQIHVAVKEALVGFDGLLGQVHAVGAQIKGIVGLVEADVTVMTDAQQLQIHAAHAADDLVVALALGFGVHVGAVRQVDVGGVDVHMVEQVAVHKAPVAFRVLLGQAAVLVQIDGGDLRKIQIPLVVALHQLLIGANGGAAGSQTQHAVGLHDDLRRNDVCCLAGHISVVLCTNDLHDKRPLFFIYSLWAVHSGTRPHLVQVYHICRRKATKRHNFSGFPFLLEKVP